ncbi:MAG TPA: hypothetical protein VGX25_11890 [Actinophytocola sp.]|uniref:hypothetical protein n=1 Tax=Actinophytocola sp. TaxID=1872138 RepID=UPI002DDD795D|nr:hypothetical protein [Actinophytocola sp.]HEV2780085.1 hypothetical protein [Actinophytocola sp.]
MPDQEEKSWVEQAGDWVEDQYSQITGQDGAPAEQEPVSVPYEEPSEEQKAEWDRQAQLGEYINAVCGQLKAEVAAVEQAAQILRATVDSASREEIEALAGQCATLSGQGYGSASQLRDAGVQDWVYSVKACNEVGYWASSASAHATSAAASEYPTEIEGFLGSVVNDLSNASISINGA